MPIIKFFFKKEKLTIKINFFRSGGEDTNWKPPVVEREETSASSKDTLTTESLWEKISGSGSDKKVRKVYFILIWPDSETYSSWLCLLD